MTLRSWLALSCLFTISSTTIGQDDRKLSFESKAGSVPTLLKLLSEPAGKTLEADPVFNNEALILSFKDVPLSTVMDRIASATLGEWTKTGKGHRLVKNKEAWKTLESEQSAKRQAGLAEAVKSTLDSRKADAVWDSKRAQELVQKERQSLESLIADLRKNNPNLDASKVVVNKGSSRASTPATPALLEILSRFPVTTLAAITPGQRVVYSSSPTRMQRVLPFNSAQAVTRFVEAHNTLASAVLSGPGSSANIRVSGGLDLAAKPISSPQLKLLVILSRGSEDPGVRMEVKFADQSGAYVGSAGVYLQPKTTSESKTPTWEPTNNAAIQYDPVSFELATALVNSLGDSGNSNRIVMRSNDSVFMMGSNSPTPAPPLSSKALEILVDPEDYDPQSTFVSEGILALASAEQLNLVAALPDSAIPVLARETIKNGKTTGFLTALNAAGVKVEKEDGWMVATPADRLAASLNQMDRAAAGRLFIPVLKNGYARLSALAKFSFSLGPTPRLSNYGYTALRLLDPFVAETLQMGLLEQSALYQFLGTLEPTVFEGLRPELMMTVGTLSASQKALLERVAYASDGAGTIIGDGEFVGIMISDNPNEELPKAPSLADEPTEVMPNGLPSNGRITLRLKPEPMVKGVVTGQRGGQFFSAGSLGGHQAFQDQSGDPGFQMKIVAFDGYIESHGMSVRLEREFVPGRKAEHNYIDAWLKPGALKVKYDQLPVSFRDAVAKAKEQMGSQRFSFGGTQPPPQ